MFAITAPGFLLFAAALLLLWRLAPCGRRWVVLLAANILFYLSLSPLGLAACAAATAVVYLAAAHARRSRAAVGIGLAASLAPLLALKLAALYSVTAGGKIEIIQIFGLGYFSLQLAGYLLDVRAGRIAPEQSFFRLLCYSTFFLSITQGPFNRYGQLMPQLGLAPQPSLAQVKYGAMRCAWGYFKKLAVAQRLAVVTDAAFANPAAFDTSQLAFAAVACTLQLYADFSGYTDIVLGVGEMLGLELPQNFAQPLFAPSIKVFWSRWHISLSNWLRDYVYIPLGGSRRGVLRRDINVILTMLISGLWHGASWTYLLWGGAHGLLQAAENHLPNPKTQPRAVRLLRCLLTDALVIILFTVFNTASLAEAAAYFTAMLQTPGLRVFANYWELGLTSRLELLMLLAGPACMLAVDALHARGVRLRAWLAARWLPLRWAVYQAAVFAFLLMGNFLQSGGGFMYQRF